MGEIAKKNPESQLVREVGWKKLSREVFRKPANTTVFCALIG